MHQFQKSNFNFKICSKKLAETKNPFSMGGIGVVLVIVP